MLPSNHRPNRGHLIAVIALILLGCGARLLFLSGPSLWLDEANSVLFVKGSVADCIRHAKTDLHPPLYYLLLHFWSLLGHDEFTLRLFSVLTNVLTGFALFGLARSMFDSRIALLTLLLFAISPFQIRYSQEVRMYSLLGLWTASALFFAWRYLTGRRRLSLAGYVLASALGLYSHYQAGVFLLVLNGAVIFRLCQTERKLLVKWLLAQGMVFALFLPWLSSFIHQAQGGGVAWLPFRPSFALLVSPLFSFLWGDLFLSTAHRLLKLVFAGSAEAGPVIPWIDRLGIAVFIALILLIVLKKRDALQAGWPVYFIFSLLAGTIGLSFGLSFMTNVFASARYLFGASLVFYIVLAALLTALSRFHRKAGFGFTLLVVLIQAAMLAAYYHPANYREDWRGAVAHIAKHSAPNDAVGFHYDQPMGPYLYYSDGSIPVFGFIAEGKAAPCLAAMSGDRYDGIWLFDYLAGLYDPQGLVRRQLAEYGYVPVWRHEFNGVPLTLWRKKAR